MIFFYCIVIMLNSAIVLNVAADSNKASITTEATTRDMWQPIIQSHYLLPIPTTSVAPAPTEATESLQHGSHTNNNLWQTVNKKNSENDGKQFTKSLKATAQPHLPTPVAPYLSLQPYLYPLNKHKSKYHIISTITPTNTKESEKHELKSYHQQPMSLNYNTAESQYAPIRLTTKDMQRQQKYPEFPTSLQRAMNESSSNYLMNKAKATELNSPNSPTAGSAWFHKAHAKQTATTNTSNDMEQILPSSLNTALTSAYLIDDIRKYQHQHSQHRHIPKPTFDINVKATKSSITDGRNHSETKLLQNLADDEKDDYRIKPKIASITKETDGLKDDGKQPDPDVFLNQPDVFYPDIDPEIINSMAHKLFKATSAALSAATAAIIKKLPSFDTENVLAAATSMLSFLRFDANETSSTELASMAAASTTSIRHLRNLSSTKEISSSAATSNATHTFRLAAASPPSKSSTLISSGRKLKKKVKKKLQQFLLPLLLAYKLKFLAFMPLLAGGLIMLVGSTGMAGFFFALFAAVMSLKTTDHGKAILVKNY